MAAKSEAETITMIKAWGALELNTRTYLAGTFLTDMTAAADQITVGDDTPEQHLYMSALKSVYSAADNFYNSVKSACSLLHITLGRLGGSQNLGDSVTNLAAWNDYLFTNSRDVESRGLTKNAWAAGSNTGTGVVLELTTDPAGDNADIGHVGTLQLICRKDGRTLGVTTGNESFQIYATKRGDYAWEEGGAGSDGGGYGYASYGRGVNEYGSNYPTINTGQELLVVAGGNTSGNLITNGDFEQSLIGTDTAKVPGFTITGTASHFSLTSTAGDKIKGDYSLDNATGGDVLTAALTAVTLRPRCPYAYTVLYRVPNDGSAGTITGNMTLVLKDDNTTHQTLTVALGSATLDAVTRASKMFIAPSAVTTNLRLEVTFPAYGGTSTDKRVYIDELVFTPLKQLDGGRAVALIAGETDFVYGDSFTASTTDAATGKLMGFINRVWGRYVKNDAVAATWSDW